MLTRRQEQIVYYLLNEVHVVSTVTLCTLFSISERTLRKDILDINTQFSSKGIEILHIRTKGYFISEQERDRVKGIILENEKYSIFQPETSEERELYILFTLLWRHEYISLEQIANEIYMSKTTVYTDFRRVEDYMEKNFGINLSVSRTKGFCLNETEEKKREVLSHIVANHGQRYKYLMKMFHKYDIWNEEEYHEILHLLHRWGTNMGYLTSNMDLIHLTLEIQILKTRMKRGFFVKNQGLNQEVNTSFPFTQLENICEILWMENERKYLLSVISKKRFVIAQQPFYDLKVSDLVDEFLQKVQKRLNHEITFPSNDVESLKGYIHTMISYLKHGVHEKAIHDISVQTEYPLFYSLALYLGPLIQNEYSVSMTETEYEQITLYLEGMIYYTDEDKNVLVVSDYPQPTIFYLIKKIKDKFHQFNIVGTMSVDTYQNHINDSYDLVLSTHLIKRSVPRQLIYVDLNLDDLCVNQILDYLKENC